jgi:HSP20 family protein
VVVELAGMRGVEISVTFERQVLSINGSRSDKNIRKAYHQIEIDYGEFAGSVKIPAPVDVDHIEATYADGFLRINLPKASPKSVSIDE